MKHFLSTIIILLCFACTPHNKPVVGPTTQADSVYIIADIVCHGDYYNSGHQVYAIDLLSEGLRYDSLGYIVGSGCNLFISDLFIPRDSTNRLPVGTYTMDSTAQDMTFLRGTHFEDNITGTYLLEIKENQIQRITLFTTGKMAIDYDQGDTIMNFELYTTDSACYKAIYVGYANPCN